VYAKEAVCYASFALYEFNPVPTNRSDYVCYWHFSDIPPALTNVRYRG
jgi:hypothetical protein